jgi:hypothetical protein
LFGLVPNLKQVNVNFFWECHGKNVNDSHFSLISRWQQEIEGQQKIRSTQELMVLMSQRAILATGSPKSVIFLEYARPKGRPERKQLLLLTGIKSMHVLQAVRGEDHVLMAETPEMLSRKGYREWVVIRKRTQKDKRKTSKALPVPADLKPVFTDKQLDEAEKLLSKELPLLFEKLAISPAKAPATAATAAAATTAAVKKSAAAARSGMR